MIRPQRALAMVALSTLGVVGAFAVVQNEESTSVPTPVSKAPHPTGTVGNPEALPATTSVEVVDSTGSPIAESLVEESDVADVVVGAVTGWGRFAVDRDLDGVAAWFHPDGPQMARFGDEVEAEAAGGWPYSVTWENREIEVMGETAQAIGTFRFIRTGEPTQRFDWSFDLRRVDDGWLVWTVHDRCEIDSQPCRDD